MNKLISTIILSAATAAVSGCTSEAPIELGSKGQEALIACQGNGGIFPMKAALAVAMATEMGRLDPVVDLTVVNGMVAVSDGAKGLCSGRGYGACTNTDAILALQNSEVNRYINQTVFNATSFKEDLKASFDRQKNHEINLRNNAKDRVPGAHQLFMSGISDLSASRDVCGLHYDFDASGDVKNIDERLVFFGEPENPWIHYIQSTDNTISLDPTGTMNGDTSTSTLSCTSACTTTATSLVGSCCACDGKQGKFARAPWNRNLAYCAY